MAHKILVNRQFLKNGNTTIFNIQYFQKTWHKSHVFWCYRSPRPSDNVLVIGLVK